MGKSKRSAESYFREISNARNRLQKPSAGHLKKWTGGRLQARPELERFGFQDKPRKEKAKIIRKILKQEHPHTKFSVTSSRARAININWENGPSVKNVEKLQFWRFNRPTRDGRGGITSHQYLFLNRRYSKNLQSAEEKRILGKYADVAQMPAYRKQEIVYREMRATDYPGAKSPGLAKTAGVARHPKKV